MNFNRDFLNNKFGIFGEEEVEKSASESSSSSCFDTRSQIHSGTGSIPTARMRNKRQPRKSRRKRKSNLQKLFKSLGICFFFQTDRCSRGNECTFSHRHISLKNKECKYFQQGRCKFGDSCLFNHACHRVHIQKLQEEINQLKQLNSTLSRELKMRAIKKLPKAPKIQLYSIDSETTVKVVPQSTFQIIQTIDPKPEDSTHLLTSTIKD
jgi:CCCH-type zinc finger/RNA-binding, Nab2-type zinc finger